MSACQAVQKSPFTNGVRIQLEELQSAVFGKIGQLGSRPQGGSQGTPRQPCSGGGIAMNINAGGSGDGGGNAANTKSMVHLHLQKILKKVLPQLVLIKFYLQSEIVEMLELER